MIDGMGRRLLAITFIFALDTLAWLVLGGSIVARTGTADSLLRGRVESTWGVPQVQTSPRADYSVMVKNRETIEENQTRRVVEREVPSPHSLAPASSDIRTTLGLEHRRKGLLWYSTYTVDFAGDYEFRNSTVAPLETRLILPLPAAEAMYDGLTLQVNGQTVTPVIEKDQAYVAATLLPNQPVRFHTAYRSQGLDKWRYSFGEKASGDKVNPVSNFHLRMNTNFSQIDFPENTLSPTAKREAGGGWELDWNYSNLVSGYDIAMTMPERLQPGPLASRMSFFAPVSLFLFFFMMLVLTTLRNLELHPVNYFFLGGAFFSFHLLFAYMVDHLDVPVAFLTSAAVSVLLVASYLRVVIGTKFAFREAALAQLTYLVLFSWAFFFEGYTGLTVTIVSILTLFVVMQMTARVRWSEKFGAPVPPPLPRIS